MTESTVFGCGIDVEELARFDRYVGEGDDSIMRGICSQREFDSLRGDDRRARFALSFCCKEAFFKALGASWTNSDLSWKDIELLFDGSGLRECGVRLCGHARDIFAGNRLHVGEAVFACDDDHALFEVVLLAEDAQARPRTDGRHGLGRSDGTVCRPRFCLTPAGEKGSHER